MALNAERIRVTTTLTTTANRYVGVQSARILACKDNNMDSGPCRSSANATLEAQHELRSAAENARSVLSPEGIEHVEIIESFFPNLYAPNVTGEPPRRAG